MSPLAKLSIALVVVLIIVAAGWFVYHRYFNLPASRLCYYDFQCENKACGRVTAAPGAPLDCCPSGETTNYAGYDYCTKMPDGSACWSGAMCAGGTCEGNVYGAKRGVCVGDTPVGGACHANDECANRACGRQTAASGAPLICCPSGDTDTWWAHDYCTKMPNGAVCGTDAMCTSGYCRGNTGPGRTGVCAGGRRPDAACTSDWQCANGACGHETAAGHGDAPLICCPSGETDTWYARDYCTGMPNGAICGTNDMCASGYCTDSWEPRSLGKCADRGLAGVASGAGSINRGLISGALLARQPVV